ncbi:MAG TPA: PAS domain S-box protein [Acetobacteraceae bacterium]|nr:PAS domain S-box protein [Acetobacteraceae bacterium]
MSTLKSYMSRHAPCGSTKAFGQASSSASPPVFPSGGGALGALIRAHDWSGTCLGPIDAWPQSLRTMVSLVLHSEAPLALLWGREGVILYNDAYALIAGARHPGLLGMKVGEGWPENADFIRMVLQEGLAGRTLSYRERHHVVIQRGVPQDIWLDLTYSPVLDEAETPAGVLVMAVEVTERVLAERRRRESEAALRESEAHYRAAVEVSPLVHWTSDAEGQVATISERWHTLTGQSLESASGVGWMALIHPDDFQQVRETRETSLAPGVPYDLEFRFRVASGSYHWCRLRAHPWRDETGRIKAWYGMAEDVQDRRAAAERLRELNETLEARVAQRTSALAEANARLKAEMARRESVEEALRHAEKMQALGQLTGGIAHDFNNLLTGIIGSLELMQRRLEGGQAGGLDRYVGAAMDSARRAARLTHRLLAFGRRQPLDPRPVALNRLVGSMEDLLRRTMGERIRIALRLEEGLPPVLCDANQLENALLNLAINARDAMPHGGTLAIATGMHDEDRDGCCDAALPQGRYVQLSVADTGVGMPSEVLAHAFEPFFTTKPLGQGTGLGLSMVHGFVHQSGGSAHIESSPGEGTRVTLCLPAAAEPAAEAPAPGCARPRAAGAGETMLVVEDDPVVRGVILEVLRDLGYVVLAAPDAAAGLAILDEARPVDLLITDLGLPGMGGQELAERARVERPLLPVLFITGYAETAAMASGFLAPGMALLTKPFTAEALAGRVRAMLGRAGAIVA